MRCSLRTQTHYVCVPARFRVGERASDNIALHLGCPSLNKVLKEALLGLEMVDLC